MDSAVLVEQPPYKHTVGLKSEERSHIHGAYVFFSLLFTFYLLAWYSEYFSIFTQRLRMELCNKYAEKHIVLEKYLDGMNSCDASAGKMVEKEK